MNDVKDSVQREIVVNASLEKVWDTLTKPEHLNKWYTKDAQIDFRVGGRGYMNHGWGAETEGVYTEIDAMHYFVLQGEDGDFTTITTLEEVEEGIKVSIVYQASYIGKMQAAAKENMLFGTGQFLENLKSVYETGKDNRVNLWRTWIGIAHTTYNGEGTRVLQVKEGSTAAKAGILSNDVITELDGEKIDGYESFERSLNEKSIGNTVTIEVQRNQQKQQLNCVVEQYPVSY
ncbi:SRPBCC domain-containing protein [Ornithinibacillus xuwenensis]|uniref:SRPBCC domain-containing protein n=1 Tax=Ornithinibacillus xuwenensis TaxID=3144668 RepID=A0ABU9XIN0_9BACI